MPDELLRDYRFDKGRIWNVSQVTNRFRVGSGSDPWNQGYDSTEEEWIDEFVYQGYLRHGSRFLKALKGRFATAVVDPDRERIFLARDWIGETPFHYLVTQNAIFVANRIEDLRVEAGSDYSYKYVRAFPQAHYQEIDTSKVDPECVDVSVRLQNPSIYVDFRRLVDDRLEESYDAPLQGVTSIRSYLGEEVRRRVKASDHSEQAVLLSGGLDSFTVALTLRAQDIPFRAYTLSIGGGGEDVVRARKFADLLGVDHHIVEVSPEEVIESFEPAIGASECYHIYNVYCAVGMYILGKRLAQQNIRTFFCGESVNEAIADYSDWKIVDPETGDEVVLQKVNKDRLYQPSERVTYVWGHPPGRGKYNRQLGTGLAKHAGARMFKPFMHSGVSLEAPYYNRSILTRLVGLPAETLRSVDGKADLMIRVFKDDFRRLEISEDFIRSCTKVRLQDASEGGEGGITQLLWREGLTQERAIEIFNQRFGADLDPRLDARRLLHATAA